MSGPIEFDHDAVTAAEHWHGGQSSMLYALASTGSLSRGSQRPQSWDEDRPMTDDEWIFELSSNLLCEAERAVKDCEKLLKSRKRNTSYDKAELQTDLDGLQSIVSTIEQWRASRATR